MEGILKFDLPDEESAFKLAKRGAEFFNSLYEISTELRNWRKYGKSPVETLKAIEEEIDDINYRTGGMLWKIDE